MTASSSFLIRWIPTPCSYTDGVFKLCIVATPILKTGDDPPAIGWLRDWPKHIQIIAPQLKLQVKVRGEGPRPRLVDYKWDAGRFWQVKYSDTPMRSMWTDLFSTVGVVKKRRSPTIEPEPVVPLLDSLGEWKAGKQLIARFHASFANIHRSLAESTDDENNLLRNLDALHGQRTQAQHRAERADDEAGDLCRFNSIVATLLRYSHLGRELGLILDGTFHLACPPELVEWIQVEVPAITLSPGEIYTDVRPKVVIESRKPGKFSAALSSSAVPGFGAMTGERLMHLDEQVTVVSPIDPIAGACRQRGAQASMTDESPGARADHLLVMNHMAVDLLKRRADRAKELYNSKEPTLFAEDLIRGFAVDLMPPGKSTWKSLCLRETTYRVKTSAAGALVPDARTLVPKVSDEGCVQISALGEKKFTNYVSDVIFRLDGWSLVCPRPFKAFDNTVSDDGHIELKVNKPVNGSIYPLRWRGKEYQLRARFIDIAGNDMSKQFVNEKTPAAGECLSFLFERVEPVAPPAIGFTSRLEAKRAEVEDTRQAARQVAVGFAKRKADRGPLQKTSSELRRIAPPHGSFQLCEFAGATDNLNQTKLLELIKRRDTSALDEYSVIADQCNHISDSEVAGLLVDYERTQPPGVTVDERVPFRGKWPNQEPIDFKFQAGPLPSDSLDRELDKAEASRPSASKWEEWIGQDIKPLKWNSAAHQMDVIVPLGSTVRLHVRGDVPGTQLERFAALSSSASRKDGLTFSLKTHGIKALAPRQRDFVAAGAELVITAPVAFPLITPRIDRVKAAKVKFERKLGEVGGEFELVVRAHAPSTGQLAVKANWVDRVQSENPTQSEAGASTWKGALVCTARVPSDAPTEDPDDYPLGTVLVKIPVRHVLPDTRYRVVHYEIEGTTRFTEFTPEEVSRNAKISMPLEISVSSSWQPDPPSVEEIFPVLLQTRSSGTDITCTSAVRFYLGNKWWSSGDKEELAIILAGGDSVAPKLVSCWGNDPIRAEPLSMSHGHLEIGNARAETFILERGPTAGQAVQLVCIVPQWDGRQDSYFAEIPVDIVHSQMPMVQFALARYQPNAIEGAKLSDIVRTEFVQLPMRRQIIVRTGDVLQVNVRGVGVMSTYIECAVFHHADVLPVLPVPPWPKLSSGKVDEPALAELFDNPLRGAVEHLRDMESDSNAVDGQIFKFKNYSVRSGDRLVVWERFSVGGGPPLPVRSAVIEL